MVVGAMRDAGANPPPTLVYGFRCTALEIFMEGRSPRRSISQALSP